MSTQAKQQGKQANGAAKQNGKPAGKPNGVAAKPAAAAPAKPQQQPKKQAAPAKKQPEPEEEEEEEEENEDDEEDESKVVGEGYYVDGDEEDEDNEDDEDEEEDAGEMVGFYSRTIAPGEDSAVLVSAGSQRCLRISNVSLPFDAPKDAFVALCVRVADHEALDAEEHNEDEEDEDEDEDEKPLPIREVTICTLSADFAKTSAPRQATVELYFQGNEIAELFVKGNASIDVTGTVSLLESLDGDEDQYGDDGPYPDYVEDEDGEDEDEEMDSEEEAEVFGAAAVHKRDATKGAKKPQRSAAKKALPSLMQELAEQGDSDEANESEFSFIAGDDDDEDDDEEDDEDMEDEETLSEGEAEEMRQALKGKIEVIDSPQLKAAKAPSPKLAPKASPKQGPVPPPTAGKKRKAEEEETPAATTEKKSPASGPQPTPAKKQKNDAAPKTPAPQTPAGATGAFKCTQCEKSFNAEGGLKQHVQTKHAAASAKKTQA